MAKFKDRVSDEDDDFCANSACSNLDNAKDRFLRIAEDFTWVNPHLSLSVTWNRTGCDPVLWSAAATDQAWRKWSNPTSPHWYDEPRLARLLANTIAYNEDHNEPCPTVWAFVRQFRGLSGTTKAKGICEAVGAARMSLADFYRENRHERVGGLLRAMQQQSRMVKPRDLGCIGKAHLRAKLERVAVAPETFDYRKVEFEHDGLPYLAEACFGFCPKGIDKRKIVPGINWSVSIGSDPFRRLGPAGESFSYTISTLADFR